MEPACALSSTSVFRLRPTGGDVAYMTIPPAARLIVQRSQERRVPGAERPARHPHESIGDRSAVHTHLTMEAPDRDVHAKLGQCVVPREDVLKAPLTNVRLEEERPPLPPPPFTSQLPFRGSSLTRSAVNYSPPAIQLRRGSPPMTKAIIGDPAS